MSRTRFRVNLHSMVAWISWNSLLETGAISEVKVTATGLEPSFKLQISRLFLARSSLTFRQLYRCRFNLKRVLDMIITYNQMHRTDNYSQHSSIIWPVWIIGWVFGYKLSGCGFKSHCCHLNMIWLMVCTLNYLLVFLGDSIRKRCRKVELTVMKLPYMQWLICYWLK